MRIGSREFDTEHGFYVMGILNVTPDSFSDGGCYTQLDAACRHAEAMLAAGCDILDIGGESTRPQHVRISSQEEIDRVCPVIEKLRQQFAVPISLDTYKADVAEAGIRAGADMINDIWGLQWERVSMTQAEREGAVTMAQVLAKYHKASCLMHNRNPVFPEDAANPYGYRRVMEDVIQDLEDSLQLAAEAGMDMDKVVIDPGIGFGKTLSDNLCVMNRLEELQPLGYPVLLGTSRKSMIGLTLNLPVDAREEGTMATTAIGAMKGCTFFRVHDVEKNRRVLDMTRAILDA